MRIRPVSPGALVEDLAARVVGHPAGQHGRVRVAVDGADGSRPGDLADALVDPLRRLGRDVVRVRAEDQWRPASLRYERGRTDPDSFYDDWLDAAGLVREVLEPLGPGGSGDIRPVRWDAANDRASRQGYRPVPESGVVLLSGPLLLGRGLPFDLTVHLDLSPGALARRTPPDLAWTLPAYARYADEVDPTALADIVIRVDDPNHPALVERS
jgi:hypothetical protein